jgi:hypothetical protein
VIVESGAAVFTKYIHAYPFNRGDTRTVLYSEHEGNVSQAMP